MSEVPILAQYVMAADALAGRTPSPAAFVGAFVEALLVTLAFLVMSARFIASDRIVIQGNRR